MEVQVVLIYLVAVNVVTFLLYGIDKWKATHHKWRIPEKTLLTFSALFGAVGAYLAMQVFRHKTRTPIFKYGVPILFVIQVIVLFIVGIKFL